MARKKIASTDIIWSTIQVTKTKKYLITSDKARIKYSLWLQDVKGCQYITTAPSPVNFYDFVEW